MTDASRPREKARSERREFRITAGLRGGYGGEGVIFHVAQATRAIERWLGDRQAQGLPVVTGMITRGDIIYGRDGGRCVSRSRYSAARFGRRCRRQATRRSMTRSTISLPYSPKRCSRRRFPLRIRTKSGWSSARPRVSRIWSLRFVSLLRTYSSTPTVKAVRRTSRRSARPFRHGARSSARLAQ